MKDHPAYNRQTVYLFFFDQGTDAAVAGYMPLNGQFGYITGYTAARQAEYYRTIAHEVAHGTFNLRHTFSPENRYVLSEGTTDNLLDYNGGTALYKYQWDLIHDPEKIWFAWLEEEGEGEIGIYGVTWLGNVLFGLYPDEQEREIETRLELFNHIYQEYENYYNNSKIKDIYLSVDKYKNWSVRKASFQGIAKKVFKGLKTNDNTFNLWNEGIYFEDYKLEGKSYCKISLKVYHQKSLKVYH